MLKIIPIVISLFLLGGGSLAAHNLVATNLSTDTNATTTVSTATAANDTGLQADVQEQTQVQAADVSISNPVSIDGFVQVIQ